MRCENINCSHNQEVIPNPGLGGIGIILSFLIPAWCTFLVVFGVFLSAKGVPCSRKNQLDHDTARGVRKLFWCISTPFRVVQAFIPAELIPRIVLLLSDQQLITATAIFVAAYGNICEIDAYHFSNVYYMGGASFLTHQVTVMVIHDQLKPHPVMRAWRMLWVIAVFALVFAANITHWSAIGDGNRVKTGWPVVCALGKSVRSAQAKQCLIVTSVFWTWGLIAVFRDICPELWLTLVATVHRLFPQIGKTFNLLIGRELCLWARRKGSKAPPWSAAHVAWWVIEKMFLLLFAFWFTILQLLTSSILDLYRIFTSLTSLTIQLILRISHTSDNETTWGFGQILPVILLALPLFQAVDLLYESLLGSKKKARGASEQQPVTPESSAMVIMRPQPVLSDEVVASPAGDGNYGHEDRHRTPCFELSRRFSTQYMDIETGSSLDDTCYAAVCRSEKDLTSLKNDSIEARLHRSVVFRTWTRLLMAGLVASTLSLTLGQGLVL